MRRTGSSTSITPISRATFASCATPCRAIPTAPTRRRPTRCSGWRIPVRTITTAASCSSDPTGCDGCRRGDRLRDPVGQSFQRRYELRAGGLVLWLAQSVALFVRPPERRSLHRGCGAGILGGSGYLADGGAARPSGEFRLEYHGRETLLSQRAVRLHAQRVTGARVSASVRRVLDYRRICLSRQHVCGDAGSLFLRRLLQRRRLQLCLSGWDRSLRLVGAALAGAEHQLVWPGREGGAVRAAVERERVSDSSASVKRRRNLFPITKPASIPPKAPIHSNRDVPFIPMTKGTNTNPANTIP